MQTYNPQQNQPQQPAYNAQPVPNYGNPVSYGNPVLAQPLQGNVGVPNYNQGQFAQQIPQQPHSNVNQLLCELSHKKGCLKCMYGFALCCYGLGAIGLIMLIATIAQLKDSGDGCYYIRTVNQEYCVTQAGKTVVIVAVLVAMGMLALQIALVGGMYRCISHHDPHKLRGYLTCFTILVTLSVLGNLGTQNYVGAIGIGIFYGIMIWKTHEYAEIVKELQRCGYDTKQIHF